MINTNRLSKFNFQAISAVMCDWIDHDYFGLVLSKHIFADQFAHGHEAGGKLLLNKFRRKTFVIVAQYLELQLLVVSLSFQMPQPCTLLFNGDCQLLLELIGRIKLLLFGIQPSLYLSEITVEVCDAVVARLVVEVLTRINNIARFTLLVERWALVDEVRLEVAATQRLLAIAHLAFVARIIFDHLQLPLDFVFVRYLFVAKLKSLNDIADNASKRSRYHDSVTCLAPLSFAMEIGFSEALVTAVKSLAAGTLDNGNDGYAATHGALERLFDVELAVKRVGAFQLLIAVLGRIYYEFVA